MYHFLTTTCCVRIKWCQKQLIQSMATSYLPISHFLDVILVHRNYLRMLMSYLITWCLDVKHSQKQALR